MTSKLELRVNNRISFLTIQCVSIIFKLITEFKHVDESTYYDYNKNTLSIDNAEVELMEINHLLRI
jgi:hypothetical protein